MYVFTLLAVLLTSFTKPETQAVDVLLTDIRNPKGYIVFGVYKDEATFAKETPYMQTKYVKTVSNGQMKLQINLEPGVYGLTMLDDENSDFKMEYNFLGLPKEGFGFSNYYHKGFTKPKFETFKFEVKKNQKQQVTIKVRYIL